jgi:hypothetical protein
MKPGTVSTKWSDPIDIGSGAAEHLRYIRRTMEASQTFTAVPGRGCIAMGLIAIAASFLELVPALAAYWLAVWIVAACLAAGAAVYFMQRKARSLGLSLKRAVAARFFMTLIPPFAAAAILTFALLGQIDRSAVTMIWLLLYGVGLAACGLFSIPAVLSAGIAFMALGTVSVLISDATAPLLLATGFGGIHIAMGVAIVRHHGG